MNGEEQLFSNGPTSLGDRDVAFSALRSKMSMLEAIVEDLGQFIYDNQLQDHFIPHIMSLAHTSKQLNKEISVVENYLDFMKKHFVAGSRTTGYFSVLPPEVTIQVFLYLNEGELCSASLVCKEWYNLASDNSLWKSLFTRNWGADATARVVVCKPCKPLPLDAGHEAMKSPSSKRPSQSATMRKLSSLWSSTTTHGPSAMHTAGSETLRIKARDKYKTKPNSSTDAEGAPELADSMDSFHDNMRIGDAIDEKGNNERFRKGPYYSSGKWKSQFLKYHRTRKNWESGKYSLVTLEHHKNTVRCVQFDENYNMITASDDKTIQRLDWDSDKEIYVPKMKLTGHEGGIICMQFDGHLMMTGSRDKTLKLWDLERGKTITTFKNHSGQVWCLQFDKNKVVSGSDDRKLNVWDIHSGKLITNLLGHSWGIGCLQFDDNKIISGAADKTIKIWDFATMQCMHTLKGHKSSVRCVQFDHQRIVSGSWDNSVKIWDINSHKCLDTLQGHTNKLMCLQFDDSKIITGAQDKTVIVWDIHTGKCLATLQSHQDSLCDLHFEDSKLITGSRDRTVKVWDFS